MWEDRVLMKFNNEPLGSGVVLPHLSQANRDFVDTGRGVLYARHTRRDNISDAIQNSRSYSSSKRPVIYIRHSI